MVVVNVPAAILAQPLIAKTPDRIWLAVFAVIATVAALLGSRWVFQRALTSYRSASS